MRRLVAGEFGKLFTTRLWLWILLACLALTALFAALAIIFADAKHNTTPPLFTAAGQRTLFSAAGASGPLVAVLAGIGLTGEFRHKTATATFLATPHRGRVVAAKLITYLLAGAGYGIACIILTLALALPWLAARHIPIQLTGNGIPATLTGVSIASAIYGLAGTGLGALLRNQAATIAALLIYLFVVEPVITRIPALDGWTIYLPGSAASALMGVVQTNQRFLPPWRGGLVLAGYGIAFALAGALFTLQRDVT